MPACGPEKRAGWDNAIALIHSPRTNRIEEGKYEPDRITFCEWFINEMLTQGQNTQRTIQWPRRLASYQRRRDGYYDMNAWRVARDNYLNPFGAHLNLPDIDYSIAFETMLTSVVCQSSTLSILPLDMQRTLSLTLISL